MKALVIALALISGSAAHAGQLNHKVKEVVYVKPADDPNADDTLKASDMAKNGPSCPLINGSGAGRDASTAPAPETAQVGTGKQIR